MKPRDRLELILAHPRLFIEKQARLARIPTSKDKSVFNPFAEFIINNKKKYFNSQHRRSVYANARTCQLFGRPAF